MLWKLIIKDVRAYKKQIAIALFAQLAMSCLFVLFGGKQTWNNYITIGYIQISAVIGYYLTLDKFFKAEILTCSLPTRRFVIILSKYVTAVFIAIIGGILWISCAYILDSISQYSPDDFYLFHNLSMLIIVIVYFTIFVFFSVPLTTLLSRIWVILILVFCYAVALFYSFKFFSSSNSDGNPLFYSINTVFTVLIGVITVLSLYFSFYTCAKLYNRKDL